MTIGVGEGLVKLKTPFLVGKVAQKKFCRYDFFKSGHDIVFHGWYIAFKRSNGQKTGSTRSNSLYMGQVAYHRQEPDKEPFETFEPFEPVRSTGDNI